MKSALITLLIIQPLTVFCQTKDSTSFRKIKIGVAFSPDVCYRILNYNASNKWIADIINGEEIPKFGLTTGVNIQYSFSKKIALELGILYSDKGEKTKTTNLIWSTPNPAFPTKSNTTFHYQYIDIPLKVNYYFQKNKIKYFISSGIAMNIIIGKKTVVAKEYSDGHKTTSSSSHDLGYSKINYSAIVGFGINYQMTKRFAILLEPIYRQSIASMVVDKTNKEYLYSIGLNAGIYYSFKRKK